MPETVMVVVAEALEGRSAGLIDSTVRPNVSAIVSEPLWLNVSVLPFRSSTDWRGIEFGGYTGPSEPNV